MMPLKASLNMSRVWKSTILNLKKIKTISRVETKYKIMHKLLITLKGIWEEIQMSLRTIGISNLKMLKPSLC